MTPTQPADLIDEPEQTENVAWHQKKALLMALLIGILCLGPSLIPGRALLPQDMRAFAPFSTSETLAEATQEATVPHGRDELLQFLPFDESVADSWSQGEVPLWSSDYFCGLPLLAQTTSRAFYPTALLNTLFSPASLYAWLYLIHLALGGFFAYRLVRRLGGSETGAQLANLCLVLSGYSMGHLHHPMIWMAGLWILPSLEALWILFERRGRESARPLLALALCTALSWFAGFSQASVLLCYLVAGTSLMLFLHQWKREGAPVLRAPLLAAGALATGLLLAAPQILPAIEMAGHSSRLPATRDQLTTASLPLAWLLEFILPGQLNPPADLAILGSPRPAFLALWWTPVARYPALVANVFNHTETAFAFGIWPFFLALSTLPGLFRRRSSTKGADSITPSPLMPAPDRRLIQTWLWAVALLGLGMALCLPGFLDLSLLLPGLGVGDAKRNLLLPALALPLLAGLGYRKLPRSWWNVGAALSLICLALSAWALLAPPEQFAEFFGRRLAARHGEGAFASFLANISPVEIVQNQHLLGFGLLRAGLALGIVPVLGFTRFQGASIFVATLVELLPLAWQMSPAPPLKSTEARLAGLPEHLPHPRPRLLRLDPGSAHQESSDLMPANLAVLQGLAEAGAYCPLPPKRSEAFFELLEAGSTSHGAGISRLRDPATLDSVLLDLLAPRFLLCRNSHPGPAWRSLSESADTGLYERKEIPPRARLFFSWKKCAGPDSLDQIRRGLGQDQDKLLLEDEPEIPLEGRDREASVEVLSWGQGRIRLRYQSRKPALLFLSEAWMPGWQARIGHHVLETRPAWLMFQAVSLPAAEGIVELTYAPDSFRNGLMLGLLGLILLGGGFLLLARAARPRLDERS